MNRLQSELQRLYLLQSQTATRGDAGTVRAVVIELTQPPCWDDLSRVWYGVQTELELPAPAIAVSGIDGLQLWFSIAEPIAFAQAQAFLEGLRARFLPDIAARRLRLMPAAPPVPALQEPSGNWSAFVAPDLAPVFADTPWLDVAPSEEGQAALLRGLDTMKPPAFEAAMAKLGLGTPPSNLSESTHSTVVTAVTAVTAADPKRFLLQVMNDNAVPMALRIEAAKVLLQSSNSD